MSIGLLERKIERSPVKISGNSNGRFRKYVDECLMHYNFFERVAKKLTRNKLDAEDLVQETYLRAIKYFGHYQERNKTKPWLGKIMRNIFINNYNKNKNIPLHRELSNTDEERLGELPKETSRIEFSRKEDILETIRDQVNTQTYLILRSIPEDYRNILIYFASGNSYENTAWFFEVPIGTVKSRIYRGKKFFRKKCPERKKYLI